LKYLREKVNLKKDILEIRPRTICPDCNAQLPCMFTANELREITNETVLRMLKAEKDRSHDTDPISMVSRMWKISRMFG
jgi:hypothetical protein